MYLPIRELRIEGREFHGLQKPAKIQVQVSREPGPGWQNFTCIQLVFMLF